MLFADYFFLAWFFPVFYLLYFLAPEKLKNLTALCGSVAFYLWGEPVYFFFLAGGVLADYFICNQITKSEGRRKKLFLGIAVGYNLLVLIYFKFAGIFQGTAEATEEVYNWTFANGALPLGISFFTFQKLSYIIDVYRKDQPPASNPWNHFLYILLFPQLVMGPIVRYSDIANQIKDRKDHYNIRNIVSGLFRFIIGLSRKLLIANPLILQVEKIFSLNGTELTTGYAWLGVFVFTLYIYFDFSGYADMAIGLGRMMGFELPENFRNPYISRSITEFWRRWHITLGRWMRDYLYKGLRNLPGGRKRRILNLWVVFLVTAIWHGGTGNFLLWGVYNGFFIMLEALFLGKVLEKAGKAFGLFYAFGVVVFGIAMFKITSLPKLEMYYEKLLGLGKPGVLSPLSNYELSFPVSFWVLLGIATFFSFWGVIPGIERWQNKFLNLRFGNAGTALAVLLALVLFILCLSELATFGFQPFLYEKF